MLTIVAYSRACEYTVLSTSWMLEHFRNNYAGQYDHVLLPAFHPLCYRLTYLSLQVTVPPLSLFFF